MVIKCEICNINNAVVKDYRNLTDEYEKYLVCYPCGTLNNYWFQKLKRAKEGLGKKIVISKIIEGNWRGYVINIRN